MFPLAAGPPALRTAFAAEAADDKIAPPGTEGPVRLLPFHDLFEELEHLVVLGFVPVKGLPGIRMQFLETLRTHLPRLEDDPVGRVGVPVVGQDPLFPLEILEGPGMGKGGEHGELGQIQLDLQEKIDEPLDAVLRVLVQSQQDRPLHGDAVVVIAFDPVADVIRGVEDGLIDVPGPGLGGQVEDLVVLLDGMAAPLLLQRDHLA